MQCYWKYSRIKDWTKMTVLKLQSYSTYRPLFSKKVKYPESEEKFCISVGSGSSDVNYEPKFDFTGLSMQNRIEIQRHKMSWGWMVRFSARNSLSVW